MKPCKKCGEPVSWKHSAGKWNCYNPDGSDHWDACSKNVWDDVKKHGKEFVVKRGKETHYGYQSAKHGVKYYLMEGTYTIGKNYHPMTHTPECTVPPWEHCGCPS